MSIESWRIKKYYRPRVLIGVEDVFDPPLPPMTLVCLTGSELLLLRNVLAYCHRRTTFVVTYGTGTYVTPDPEQWDTLQAIVSELEDKLMAGCEDLIDRLDQMIVAMLAQNVILEGLDPAIGAIDTTLLAQNVILEGLDPAIGAIDTTLLAQNVILEGLEPAIGAIDTTLLSIYTALLAGNDILDGTPEAIACICARLGSIQQDPATTTIINHFIDSGGLQEIDAYPGDATPAEDAEACAIAQLMWYFMYETLTEIVQPAQEKAVSILLPLAMAVIASWVGTPLLGIPVGALLVLIWDIIEVWVVGSLEGVANSIFNNKDELICAAYTVLRDTGDLAAVSAAVGDVIDEIGDLSPIDKVVMRSLSAPWVLSRMALAWENLTAWATARVTAGYCTENCPEEPFCGSDWCAVPYVGPEIELDHTVGAYWLTGCWPYDVVDAKRTAGVFYEVLEHTGNCQLKRMNGIAAGCGSPATLWDNTSDVLTPGWYFSYKTFEFDDAECLAAVHPGATEQSSGHAGTNGPIEAGTAFQMGWNCTGYARIAIRYIIYNGGTFP